MKAAFKKFDLTGKTALITGGATGIGLELTRALAQSGAKVMIAARREGVLKKVAEELMAAPEIESILYRRVDLADQESVKALSDHAISTMCGVDIFIGNAAIDGLEFVDSISRSALDRPTSGQLGQ